MSGTGLLSLLLQSSCQPVNLDVQTVLVLMQQVNLHFDEEVHREANKDLIFGTQDV